MKRLFFLLPLAVFLGMAVYFGIGLTKDPRIIPSALIDQPVPNFELPPLKPQKPGLATADLKGEVAIVNVFASSIFTIVSEMHQCSSGPAQTPRSRHQPRTVAAGAVYRSSCHGCPEVEIKGTLVCT